MNAAQQAKVTKIMAALEKETGAESLGFKRYFVLPNKTKKSLGAAHVIQGGAINKFIDHVVSFFGEMNDSEYKTWVASNA